MNFLLLFLILSLVIIVENSSWVSRNHGKLSGFSFLGSGSSINPSIDSRGDFFLSLPVIVVIHLLLAKQEFFL